MKYIHYFADVTYKPYEYKGNIIEVAKNCFTYRLVIQESIICSILMKMGLIEHRDSDKTGGYYAK